MNESSLRNQLGPWLGGMGDDEGGAEAVGEGVEIAAKRPLLGAEFGWHVREQQDVRTAVPVEESKLLAVR